MTEIRTKGSSKRFADEIVQRHCNPVGSHLRGNGRTCVQPATAPHFARLPDGLQVAFERAPDESCPHARRLWRFRLLRENHYPSADEVETCCLAFHVPPAASERRFVHFRPHPKTGRRIHHHIVEFSWAEEDEVSRD